MNTEHMNINFAAITARLKVLEEFLASKYADFPAINGKTEPLTPDDRRRKLINILNQARVDQNEHLHNGRTRVISPVDDYADKIEALFASQETTNDPR